MTEEKGAPVGPPVRLRHYEVRRPRGTDLAVDAHGYRVVEGAVLFDTIDEPGFLLVPLLTVDQIRLIEDPPEDPPA